MKMNEFIQMVDTWMETFESHHLSGEKTEEICQGVRLNPKRLFYFICVILLNLVLDTVILDAKS